MENYRSSEVLNPMHELPPATADVTRGGWMGRVDELKSRGTDLMNHVKHVVTERSHTLSRNVSAKSADMKRMAIERSSSVKPMIHDAMGKAEREFHTNPTKWAGIAAGASFVIGMIGRELRHRRARRRALPDLVIIETA